MCCYQQQHKFCSLRVFSNNFSWFHHREEKPSDWLLNYLPSVCCWPRSMNSICNERRDLVSGSVTTNVTETTSVKSMLFDAEGGPSGRTWMFPLIVWSERSTESPGGSSFCPVSHFPHRLASSERDVCEYFNHRVRVEPVRRKQLNSSTHFESFRAETDV